MPKKVLDEEQDRNTTLAALRELRDCCSKKQDPLRFETLTKEIEKAEKELEEFIERLRKEYPHYASVKYPKPVKLQDLDLSKVGHAVVYDVTGDGVSVKLLKGNEIVTAFFEPWDAKDLSKAVTKFRKPFDEVKFEAFDPALAEKLYKRLLAPVIDKVPAGTPIMIIPDGPLALLPFDAPVMKGKVEWKTADWGRYPTGLTYLGDVYPLRLARSLTALGLLQAKKTAEGAGAKAFLGIADAVFKASDPRAAGAGQTQPSAKPVKDAAAPVTLMGVETAATPLAIEFERLDQTEALVANLTKLFGETSTVYTGLKATKSVFFDEVAPKMPEFKNVVFATHGVYSTEVPGLLEPILALTMVHYNERYLVVRGFLCETTGGRAVVCSPNGA